MYAIALTMEKICMCGKTLEISVIVITGSRTIRSFFPSSICFSKFKIFFSTMNMHDFYNEGKKMNRHKVL